MREMVFGRDFATTPRRADELDLVAQKSALELQNVSTVFPRLRCVQIMGVIEWYKLHNNNSNHTSWSPRVLDKERLKITLEGPIAGVVRDVENCIARAFMPGELHAEVLARRGLV